MAGYRAALPENAPGAAGARPAADGRLGEPDAGPATDCQGAIQIAEAAVAGRTAGGPGKVAGVSAAASGKATRAGAQGRKRLSRRQTDGSCCRGSCCCSCWWSYGCRSLSGSCSHGYSHSCLSPSCFRSSLCPRPCSRGPTGAAGSQPISDSEPRRRTGAGRSAAGRYRAPTRCEPVRNPATRRLGHGDRLDPAAVAGL